MVVNSFVVKSTFALKHSIFVNFFPFFIHLKFILRSYLVKNEILIPILNFVQKMFEIFRQTDFLLYIFR